MVDCVLTIIWVFQGFTIKIKNWNLSCTEVSRPLIQFCLEASVAAIIIVLLGMCLQVCASVFGQFMPFFLTESLNLHHIGLQVKFNFRNTCTNMCLWLPAPPVKWGKTRCSVCVNHRNRYYSIIYILLPNLCSELFRYFIITLGCFLCIIPKHYQNELM